MRRANVGRAGFSCAAVVLFLFCLATLPAHAQYPPPDSYPAELDHVEILFADDTHIRLRDGVVTDLDAPPGDPGLVQLIDDALMMLELDFREWSRLEPSVPEATLDIWELEGELASGEDVYNLNNVFRLRFGSPLSTAWDVGLVLEELPFVIAARPVPLPPELPAPDLQSSQGYLQPSTSTPAGIDALHAWSRAGGDGTGITICDLEYSWNTAHVDLSQLASAQINSNVVDPFNDTRHGTAVAGVLAADANGSGVTGIAFGAQLLTCGTNYGLPASWNPGGAMIVALNSLSADDIILIEQQWSYTGNTLNYVPVEWYTSTQPYAQTFNSVYAAIQNAVTNGVHVVEAGGNGGVDTGTLAWLGDSGAIVVGAGGAYTGGTHPNGDRQRLGFSSYGPRFDLQGWGEDVATCAYGDLHNGGTNDDYTAVFDGTSAASPVVAGAMACVLGWYRSNVGGTLSPALLRQTLINTGTPQVIPPAGHIGPRPDVKAAISSLQVQPWVDATSGPLAQAGNSMAVAWADFDGDGDDDLYLTQDGAPNVLFANQSGTWTVVAAPATQDTGPNHGAVWGDYDADGDPDLYLVDHGVPNRLVRNDHPLGFADVSLPPIDDPGTGSSASWVDADGDGYLELALAQAVGMPNALYDWSAPLNFVDVSPPAVFDPGDQVAVIWCDVDLDGDQDAYLTSASGQPNRLCRNDGGLFFANVAQPPIDTIGNSFGAAFGDYDNDGDFDLFVVNYGQSNQLFRNDGPGVWIDVSSGPIPAGGLSWNVAWADYDNDADLDCYVTQQGPNQLLRNDGGGVFTDVATGPLADTNDTRGAAWADYDNDGELDLYLANHGTGNVLVRNDLNTGNHWIQLEVRSPQYGLAVGSTRVECHAAGLVQVREVGAGSGYLGQNSHVVHFGLGPVASVDSLVVHAATGAHARLVAPAIDTRHTLGLPVVTAVGDGPPRPERLALRAPSPNPFNPRTTIRFELPAPASVDLWIVDLRGRTVRSLIRGQGFEAGVVERVWDGRDEAGRPVASGNYVIVLEVGIERLTRRATLVR